MSIGKISNTKRRVDLHGKTFGLLKVISMARDSDNRAAWLCLCECGNKNIVKTSRLTCGNDTSCGCKRGGGRDTHKHSIGKKHTPEYSAWAGILQRCRNKNNKSYSYYGGRGIKVCKRWLKFENFISDMGFRPSSKTSIERIDNNGNYEPSNCIWATADIQVKNRRQPKIVAKPRKVNGDKWTARFMYKGISYKVGIFHSYESCDKAMHRMAKKVMGNDYRR